MQVSWNAGHGVTFGTWELVCLSPLACFINRSEQWLEKRFVYLVDHKNCHKPESSNDNGVCQRTEMSASGRKKKTCIQQKLGDGLWLLIFLWILADPYFICGGSMLSVWLSIWIQKLWISNMRHWRTTQELKQSELSSELLLDCILGLMTIIGFLGKKGHRHKQEQRRRERESE